MALIFPDFPWHITTFQGTAALEFSILISRDPSELLRINSASYSTDLFLRTHFEGYPRQYFHQSCDLNFQLFSFRKFIFDKTYYCYYYNSYWCRCYGQWCCLKWKHLYTSLRKRRSFNFSHSITSFSFSIFMEFILSSTSVLMVLSLVNCDNRLFINYSVLSKENKTTIYYFEHIICSHNRRSFAWQTQHQHRQSAITNMNINEK